LKYKALLSLATLMASYTVVIVPLRSSPNSLDALQFFLWVKKMKDLEREKDFLWIGLQALEKVIYIYFLVSTCLYLLVFNIFSIHQVFPDPPTLLLAQIHRVNRTLRNLLCDSRNPTDPAIEGHSFNNVHQIPVKALLTLHCHFYVPELLSSMY
uniref:Si:ch211-266k8.6 n=1 Tax=Sinocyclocheilus rhinocerous TaxID=307959 RepID=A0A673IPK1_9TELE